MAEYINREAAIEKLDHFQSHLHTVEGAGAIGVAKTLINEIPAADVQPVKRGHWVKRMEEHATPKYTSFTPIWSCSECGLEYDPALAPRIHFCYNCGADMQ